MLRFKRRRPALNRRYLIYLIADNCGSFRELTVDVLAADIFAETNILFAGCKVDQVFGGILILDDGVFGRLNLWG